MAVVLRKIRSFFEILEDKFDNSSTIFNFEYIQIRFHYCEI